MKEERWIDKATKGASGEGEKKDGQIRERRRKKKDIDKENERVSEEREKKIVQIKKESEGVLEEKGVTEKNGTE